MTQLDLRDIALLAANAADEKKATDVLVLDVAEKLVITSYFVVATAANDRLARAIAEDVETALREKAHMKPIGREGEREGKWILLDFGDIVVHIFQPEEREFYRLEKLWSDVPKTEVGTEAAGESGPEAGTTPETDASAEPEPTPAS